MKLLVLISLVAFCSSQSTYVGKHVTVGSDGLITVVGEQGRQINIYRNAVYPRKIDIVLKSVYGPTRKIEVDEVNNIHNVDFNTLDSRFFSHGGLVKNFGNDYTQHDVLVHLFREYQGLVDSVQYEKILETIHYLVQHGVLHESIWNVLRYFDNFYHAQKYQQYFGNEKFVPREEEYGVGHYGSEYSQKMSPLGRLYSAFQQRKYNQEHNEEYYPQHFSQQYDPEYHYGQFQKNPLAKYFNVVKGEKVNYPYQSKYQTHQEFPQGYEYQQGYYHQQVYPQGYYHQQEYPQGYYHQQEYAQGYLHQQEYPQGYYHQLEYPQGFYHQQKYNQQWWNPQQYTQYHKQVYPQEWTMAQQHHYFGKIPTVY